MQGPGIMAMGQQVVMGQVQQVVMGQPQQFQMPMAMQPMGARLPPSCASTFFMGPCAISGYETGDSCHGTSCRECAHLGMIIPCLPPFAIASCCMFCCKEFDLRSTKGTTITFGSSCNLDKFYMQMAAHKDEPGCCCIRPIAFFKNGHCCDKGHGNASFACLLYPLCGIVSGVWSTFCWKPDPNNIVYDGTQRYMNRGSICPFHVQQPPNGFLMCWSGCVSCCCLSAPYHDPYDMPDHEKCQCLDGSPYSFPALTLFACCAEPCIQAFYAKGDLCNVDNCALFAPVCFICNFIWFQSCRKVAPTMITRTAYMHGGSGPVIARSTE